jgi:hypothetical protein
MAVTLRVINGNNCCNELSDFIYAQTRKALRIIRPNEKIEDWDDILIKIIKKDIEINKVNGR